MTCSKDDPTTVGGSRARGIISLALGRGPTSGLTFALGADSRLHTYNLPTLSPLDTAETRSFTHDDLRASSFYVQTSVSPCGRWVATGSTGSTGSVFLFDVANASRVGGAMPGDSNSSAVQLRGQTGEIGGLDWADNALATCADDGTVRIWRPDVEVYRRCRADPVEQNWNWNFACEF